jgi:hypothetical protein
MQTTIHVKCTGESVDFDTESLPPATVEFVFNYGLKQWVNDGAAKQRANFDSDEEFESARVAGANERIERLRSGDVPGTRAPASPATKLGRQVAAAAVEAGIDVTKIDPAKLLAALRKMAA